VVSVEDFEGGSPTERFYKAQAAVAARGGGIVYFPPGTYQFGEHIRIRNGVVIRGADPVGVRTAGGITAIYAVANRNSGSFECRNVTIEDNITAGSGIQIAGEPASNNIV
jgi:hypothetical protein